MKAQVYVAANPSLGKGDRDPHGRIYSLEIGDDRPLAEAVARLRDGTASDADRMQIRHAIEQQS